MCGAPTGMTFSNGAQQTSNAQPVLEKKEKKGKKAVIITVVAAVLVLALSGAGVMLYLQSDGYQCKKNMQLAEKSYEAEEYQEALA
ncbi:MAG: hypothetical protein K2M81_04070, partial [Lachnospiraceae bacterium]|nr:hypothetical protein [Lachnospiraceae bacterium]